MPIIGNRVTLAAATATRIASGSTGDANKPVSVIVYNATAGTLYLGGSGVTDSGATQGFPVSASSSSPGIDLIGDDLWAYSTAGGNVNVLVTAQ